MVCGVIDIGSNTTRLLVAEVAGPGAWPQPLAERRAYTRIGAAIDGDGRLPTAKAAEVAAVVAEQLGAARELGCERIRAIATAAIREAAQGGEAAAAISSGAGIEVEVLSAEQEGELAFRGATGRLQNDPGERLAVVDVGGGSCEVVVGTREGGVEWMRSLRVGSGSLTAELITLDPPSLPELDAVAARVTDLVAAELLPPVERGIAVGGSATSLFRLAGPELDLAGLDRVLAILAADPAAVVARRFALDVERVRLLPAGVILLRELARAVGHPLAIGAGGVREGAMLELAVRL